MLQYFRFIIKNAKFVDVRHSGRAFTNSIKKMSISPLLSFVAETAFLAANFNFSLKIYSNLSDDLIVGARARLMKDWISFHLNDFSSGWPRYPDAHFIAPSVNIRISPNKEIIIDDPRKPDELVTHIGMTQLLGLEIIYEPILVWFNFRDSIGGEILVSRLIRSLQKRYTKNLILACNKRLISIFRTSFPDCEVIDNSLPINHLAERCKFFILGRDLLGLLVHSEADFLEPAAEKLQVDYNRELPFQKPSARPQIALSWKTTNAKQARYRNIPIKNLAKILAKHDFDWHIAQHGELTRDLSTMRKFVSNQRIHTNTIHPKSDISDLAKEIIGLDAIITIDNSLLHLAGGLGVKTFALISKPSYWAWPADGENCRWYSSVRMLRQMRPGDWASVLTDLDIILQNFQINPVIVAKKL